jgi:hypothetical protein
MASAMMSLGEFQGYEEYNSNKIHASLPIIENRKFGIQRSIPIVREVTDEAPDKVEVLDLNIRDLQSKHFTHLIDVVHDFNGPVDVLAMMELVKASRYKDLPPPFGPNSEFDAPYTMQLNINKQENNKWLIVKWFLFDEKQTAAKVLEKLIYGEPFEPAWCGVAYVHHVKKVLHYLFERLVGTNILYLAWASEQQQTKKQGVNPTSRQLGYAFIQKRGPKANNMNQFVEWTDEQVNDPNSPIYEWQEGRVKESLSNYAKGTVGAKTLTQWAVSMRKFHPHFLNRLIIPMCKTHDIHSVLWVGKSRAGKSTASKTMCFCISAYQIDHHARPDLSPSVVTARKIDFFRLEPGSKFKPAIADDIIMSKMGSDEAKAFGDPAEEDALLWARWGGASFEQTQHREACVNPYDVVYEKNVTVVKNASGEEEISLSDFIRIIQVNWPTGSTEEDVEAYLNRYHIVLLSNTHVYFRLAASGDGNVIRMPWPDPKKTDLFIPEVSAILRRFKKDPKWKPDDYGADFDWGVSLLHTIAAGQTPAKALTITGPTLVSEGASTTTYKHPVLKSRASFQFKRSASSLGSDNLCIDLDSHIPSPIRKDPRVEPASHCTSASSSFNPNPSVPAFPYGSTDENVFDHPMNFDP